MSHSLLRKIFVASAFAMSIGAAHAAYPDRPIRVVVPSAAGGSPDIVVRIFSNEIGKKLGQSLVVDNRPGAAGNIGMQAVMTAQPDGYTIGYGNNATLTTNEFLFTKLPYDPNKLEPVVLLTKTASVLVVNNNLPVKNVQELVQYCKQHGDKVSFGSAGIGTSAHIGAELFKTMTGIKAVHVPYKGAPQAQNDLMAGNVQFMFDNFGAIGPNVKAGKVRALAVTSKARTPLFPDVPTMDEAGVKAFEMTAWGAIIAPPGTPAEIVTKLNKAFNEVMQDKNVQAQLQKLGSTPVGGTPDDARKHIKAERAKWGEVVRKSGAKVE
ncbi:MULTISPECIES: Bug family tripartite tricarboxylate transporter substrate binding protein [Cupriavidus]|uniref:Bug family tripartite tricarboxylate transporter substrate binding protein n=1 Tax=Cupriavidus sp. DF5525 TaxID=3160989 RepID=UPI0003B0CE3E|nr:hypothetical protein N234_26370 [Ralstonia pickettii DTP0602]